MIKLVSIQPKDYPRIRLRFSDGTWGDYDFSEIVGAGTVMTKSLEHRAYFESCFIEQGALAWPNGLDFSARSLHQKLAEAGSLHQGSEAA